jgi:hypothetical protein
MIAAREGMYAVRWGTEEMLREVPDDLLPAVHARAGQSATIITPASHVFARLEGPGLASAWQELGRTTTLTPVQGMRARIQVVTDTGKPVSPCTARLSTIETPQPHNLSFLAACDTEGIVALPGLPIAPRYRLQIKGHGVVPRTITTDLRNLATLELHTGAGMHGRVLDDGRKPVAGASIRARFLLSGEWVTQRAASTANGTFGVGGIGQGQTEISITRRGYAPDVQVVSMRDADVDVGDVILHHGLSLAVRVTTADGVPIAHANVRERGARASTTDRGGLATLRDIPPDGTDVQVSAPGYLPATSRLAPRRDRAPTPIRLHPAAGIRLRTVNTQQASAGPGTVILESEAGTATGTLDETGMFEALDLQPGTYTLEIHAGDLAPTRVGPRDVRAGNILDLGTVELLDGTGITGTVIDADTKAPIPNAHLIAMPTSDSGPGLALLRNDLRETTSTADGTFHLLGLAPGMYALGADAAQHARAVVDNIVVSERNAPIGELALPAARTLVVHCAPIDGCGAQAQLLVGGPRRQWAGIAAPIDQGLADLTPVPAGRFLLRLSGDQGVIYQQDVEVSGTQDTTEVSLDLHTTLVNGMVVCNGRPAGGGSVILQRDIPDRLITVNRTTDFGTSFPQNLTPFARQFQAGVADDGSFRLPNVGPGAYLATYQRDGSASPSQLVVIPAAETYALTLTLAGAAIHGIVFEGGGRPASATHIALFRDHQQLASALTGDDGRFTFLGTPPGELIVRAERDRLGAEVTVALPREAPVTLVLQPVRPVP